MQAAPVNFTLQMQNVGSSWQVNRIKIIKYLVPEIYPFYHFLFK